MASIDHRGRAAWTGIAVIATAMSGCGRPVSWTEVSGTVTLDNRPLAGMTVVFFPSGEGDDSRLISQGTTDSSGRYTLAGPDGQTGAVIGTHRVVVRPPKTPRSSQPPPPLPGPPIPAKYGLPKLSPLVVEVQAGGTQTVDLPLTSD
jgi:hypothetical protein